MNTYLSMRDLIDIATYECVRVLYINPSDAGELLPPHLKWVHDEWIIRKAATPRG